MDPELRCPPHLLKILLHQSSLRLPSIHVRYMKFRERSPSGFIGRRILVVCNSKYI